ncbi:unnamed protein product [Cunninghamella blakesleeana]
MVSFNSILTTGLMMVMTIQALPVADSAVSLDKRGPDDCLGFRITSPQASGLKFTYGQCYEVSWDLGASTVNTIKQINLINSKSGKSVGTLKSNLPASKLSSGNFSLRMSTGAVEGDYHYQVVAATADPKTTCKLNSATFHVIVNPNSPPSNC